MFLKGSRYERVKDYVATDAKEITNKVKQIRQIEKLDKAFVYVIEEGDRLDNLANRFYGDPTKFWIICDANDVMFPSDLVVPGMKIIIPQENI